MPKTILEDGRQTLDLIEPDQRFSAGFETTGFWLSGFPGFDSVPTLQARRLGNEGQDYFRTVGEPPAIGSKTSDKPT